MQTEDFSEYLKENCKASPPIVGVDSVLKKIKSMNKKAATLEGDLPMKLIAEFSEELSFPLANIINECLHQGVYPGNLKQ